MKKFLKNEETIVYLTDVFILLFIFIFINGVIVLLWQA